MSAVAIAADARAEVRSRARSAAIGPSGALPVIAVLCDSRCARTAAAAVALALARFVRRPVALAAAVSVDGPPSVLAPAVPAARRAVARLHERGQHASASSRLVWLGNRHAAWAAADADAPGVAAAASSSLGRATAVVRAPAALAIPLARTTALDRVLRWHDGIVIVRDADTTDDMLDCVRRSLAALDRPVAEMPCIPRLAATAAELGIVAPAAATRAVAALRLGPPNGGES
jgi:hypothetical protein